MKIVIEIPDHVYEHAKNMSEDSNDEWDAMRAIAKGFPYEERQHGEWINEDYGIGECFAECSECGEETNGNAKDTGFGYDYSFPNFCPNCGADMRKEGDPD